MKNKKKKNPSFSLEYFTPIDTTDHINVSEKQLLISKTLEDKSPYYHSIDKGCDIEEVKLVSKNKYGRVHYYPAAYCKTHGVDVCRCGWQQKYHYGTYSPGITNQILIIKTQKEVKKETEIKPNPNLYQSKNICRNCGNEFIAHKNTKRYCSKQCRLEYYHLIKK